MFKYARGMALAMRIVNALMPVQEAILARKSPGPMVDRPRRAESRTPQLRAAPL
jgi:hypothetical protein